MLFSSQAIRLILCTHAEQIHHRGMQRRVEEREKQNTFKDLIYPDLQALDLCQVSFLSLLQPPPLCILLLDKLHLSEETRRRRDGDVLS